MRTVLILAACVAFVGCASGAPCAVGAAPKATVYASQTLGFRPEVKQAVMIPVDTAACVAGTCTAIIGDLVQGARCVLDTLVPTVNPTPPPSYAAPAPCLPAYEAPKAGPACGR